MCGKMMRETDALTTADPNSSVAVLSTLVDATLCLPG
jgi:hypothetical protein